MWHPLGQAGAVDGLVVVEQWGRRVDAGTLCKARREARAPGARVQHSHTGRMGSVAPGSTPVLIGWASHPAAAVTSTGLEQTCTRWHGKSGMATSCPYSRCPTRSPGVRHHASLEVQTPRQRGWTSHPGTDCRHDAWTSWPSLHGGNSDGKWLPAFRNACPSPMTYRATDSRPMHRPAHTCRCSSTSAFASGRRQRLQPRQAGDPHRSMQRRDLLAAKLGKSLIQLLLGDASSIHLAGR